MIAQAFAIDSEDNEQRVCQKSCYQSESFQLHTGKSGMV